MNYDRVAVLFGLLLPGFCLLLAACGAAEQPRDTDPTAAVRDSVGVRIVTNPDVPLPVWRVDTEPFLTIGTLDGLDGQDLGNPWASTSWPDGGVAISDAGTDQVRLYDATGAHFRSVGGAGSGPGEFGTVAAIYVGRGDSLVVADTQHPRLTVFARNGDFGRIIQVERWEGRVLRMRGLLNDTIGVYRAIFSGMNMEPGIHQDSVVVGYRPLDGEEFSRIGTFDGNQSLMVTSGSVMMGMIVPFARTFHAAVADSLVWIGEAETYGFVVYDADGRLHSHVRLDRPAVPVGSAERARYLEWNMDRDTSAAWRQRQRESERHLRFPESMATYTDLHADAVGRIWVREYQAPWVDELPVWRIFAADGQQLATTILPPGLDVHMVGRDYVLGRWTGEMGVPHIGAFRIHLPD